MLIDASPWQNMALFTDYLRCDNNILMVLCKVAWKLMSDKEQIQVFSLITFYATYEYLILSLVL